jgi:pyruvate/2-oxoglutarate dehydrogenase complex dihydrolipoamide acyltransferase (E2) component
MAESEKNKVTMEINSPQLGTIKGLFGHYNSDINTGTESFVSENGGKTQNFCVCMPPQLAVLFICNAGFAETIWTFIL